MEARHIQLDFREAIETKKQILHSQLNILQSLKKIRTYNTLRKKEYRLKNEFKSKISSLKLNVNSLLITLPDVQELEEKFTKKISKEIVKEPRETKELQKELEDIKKKLEKLGG